MLEDLIQVTKVGGVILLLLMILDIILQIRINKYERDENEES